MLEKDLQEKVMSVPTKLLFAVINKFSADNDESQRRFQNFISFLGVGGDQGDKSVSKEAAERARGDVRKMLRDWFFDIIGNYIRAGYFSKKNRAQHEWRDEVWQNTGKMLHDKLRYSLLQEMADYAKRALGQGVRIDELSLPEDVIDQKIFDLLSDMQGDREFIQKAVNVWLRQQGGFKEKNQSPEVEEAKSRKRKEYQQGLAEVWFRPIVTDDVYDEYKKFVKDHQDTTFKRTAERIKTETGRTQLVPEDIGVHKGRVDPTAFKILNEMGKFNLEIHDTEPAYDTREKKDTWQVTFSIPELAQKMPSLYDTALYTLKIPPSVRSLDPTDEIPVSVQHSYDTKTGKKGMSIRLDDVYQDWTEDTMDTFNDVGFLSKDRFEKFVDALATQFKRQWRRGKNLDEMVADLGGDVRFHGRSFATADDLADLADQLSGRPSTVEELRAQREIGDFEERMQEVRKMTDRAIDVAGEKVQGYFGGIDKPQGEAMREAIVKVGNYPSLSALTDLIRTGQNLRISWNNLFQTAEIVNKALEFIFHPQVSPGDLAWKTHLLNYLKEEAPRNPDFMAAIKWITYKDKLAKSGKKGAALKDALSKTTVAQLTSQVSDQEALEIFRSKLKEITGRGTELTLLQNSIKKTVESKLRTHPAFRKFWERQKTWDAAIKPDVETKVERVLMGDEDIPRGVKMAPELKAKVIETTETEKKTKAGKPIKEQRIDLSELESMEGATGQQVADFVGDLVDHYVNKKLQQMWRKERQANSMLVRFAFKKANIH
jgi:hypothetical protein